jgi:hypothetical protein
MNRKSKFIIGLSTAVITFGLLYATLGQQHFNRGHKCCHKTENCCGHQRMEKCENSPEVGAKDGTMDKKASINTESTKN